MKIMSCCNVEFKDKSIHLYNVYNKLYKESYTAKKPCIITDVVKDSTTLYHYVNINKLEVLFKECIELNSDISFVHNDMHLGNILYDTINDKYVLIDYGRSYVDHRQALTHELTHELTQILSYMDKLYMNAFNKASTPTTMLSLYDNFFCSICRQYV